jgi:hypothetical protein
MGADLKQDISPRDVPLDQRVAQVRYDLTWQGTAVRIQYDRLAAYLELPPEQRIVDHMSAVVDLDFLIMAVRRLLKVAQRARRLGVDGSGELRQAVRDIGPQSGQVIMVRNALEHFEEGRMGILPVAGGGSMSFVWPGGQMDMHELFRAAEGLRKAILRVIEKAEQA